jgi:hypothetical protein
LKISLKNADRNSETLRLPDEKAVQTKLLFEDTAIALLVVCHSVDRMRNGRAAPHLGKQ